MTRKQYRGKMMRLQRNLNKYAKEHGLPTTRADDVNTPNWGYVIEHGKYKGETLLSYEQAWNMVTEALKGCDCIKGII